MRELPLVCAGSGLAIGLPRNFGIAASTEAAPLPAVHGFAAIVSGSCSAASNAQVADFIRRGGAARRIDPLELAAGDGDDALAAELAAWAGRHAATSPAAPVLVYSTAAPAAVAAAQARGGAADLGARLERLLAAVVRAMVERGARRLVVAGGETAGACVQALGVERLRIGRQIDPGVPWCHAAPPVAADGLHLALKSGNFGGVDFFSRAFALADVSEAALREALCRIGHSLFARGYVHGTTGNLSARLDDGFLVTATDACLGELDPAALVKVDPSGAAGAGAGRPSKTIALHLRIYAAAASAAGCIVHTHSRAAVGRSLGIAADESRDDFLPPVTPYFVMKVGHVPLLAYARPGDPAVAERVAAAIAAAELRGAPIRAVMLSRLGPTVWHETPAAAMAVLEELEETARLCLGAAPPPPLTDAEIEELRRHFGARW